MRERFEGLLRLGQHLAERSDNPTTAAESAAALGIPYTTLLEWWRHLEFQRAILPAREGRGVVVDRPRLLQTLTAHQVARLAPTASFETHLGPQALCQALERHGIPHCLGMMSAANEWAFFEPRRSVQMYVPRSKVAALRAQVSEARRETAYRIEVFPENFDHLLPVHRAEVPVTPLFRTLIDCRAHPEGGAHAYFLEKELLRWGEEKGGP